MSSLEELKKKLYQKGASFRGRQKKPEIFTGRSSAPSSWQEPQAVFAGKERGRRFLNFLIVIAVLILLAVAGLALYLVLRSGGFISTQAVDLNIQAPASVNGGDKVSWRVDIGNKGKVPLEGAEFIIDYPPGSQPIGAGAKEGQLRERRALGAVPPGGTREEIFEAFVFGEEESEKHFKAVLEYRLEGSSAIFAKEKEYVSRIAQSAIGLSINLPSEAKAGQEVVLRLQYVLNSSSALKNISLLMNYPDGFEFGSADPQPSESNNNWSIENINSGSQGRIAIRGILRGEDLEKKVFQASIGKMAGGSLDAYGKTEAYVTLKRPFLDISAITVNGSDEPVVKAGDNVNVELSWKNNLPVAVKNMIIEAKVSGAAFNPVSVHVDQGVFRGSDQTLVWRASSNPRFSSVEPGQEGTASFGFRVLTPLPIFKESDTRFVISVSGRIYAGDVPEGFGGVDIESSLVKDIKISSDIQFARRGLYYSGPFANQGALPPKVGKETTYTIIWSVINSANDVKNSVLRATLPGYVSWKNAVSPALENVSYDSASGNLVWNIGDLKAGTGIIRPAREVAFQIGFIPAVNQVRSSPLLVSEAVLEGSDSFTGAKLRDSKPALTTELYESDPQVPQGKGLIAE